MNAMKLKIFVLIMLLPLSGCALMERHHSFANSEIIDHENGFRYELGAHRRGSEAENRNVSINEAELILLDEALTIKKLCPNGYKVKRKMYTRHSDVTYTGICSK
jgi:hypothetical protein